MEGRVTLTMKKSTGGRKAPAMRMVNASQRVEGVGEAGTVRSGQDGLRWSGKGFDWGINAIYSRHGLCPDAWRGRSDIWGFGPRRRPKQGIPAPPLALSPWHPAIRPHRSPRPAARWNLICYATGRISAKMINAIRSPPPRHMVTKRSNDNGRQTGMHIRPLSAIFLCLFPLSYLFGRGQTTVRGNAALFSEPAASSRFRIGQTRMGDVEALLGKPNSSQIGVIRADGSFAGPALGQPAPSGSPATSWYYSASRIDDFGEWPAGRARQSMRSLNLVFDTAGLPRDMKPSEDSGVTPKGFLKRMF